MSLIKKADVKNHLSARHRNEIHLYQPEGDPKTARFAGGEPAGVDAKVDEPVESRVKPITPSGPEAVPTVAPSDSAQSKSVQP